jgi:hypothetical protein
MLIKVRDEELISLMRKELLGPGSEISIPDDEHEIISDLPETRYSIGILYPQKNEMGADNNEIPSTMGSRTLDEEIEDTVENDVGENEIEDPGRPIIFGGNGTDSQEDIGTLDDEIGLSAQHKPSSMGLTFFINQDTSQLTFDISFGTYRRVRVEECKLPFYPDNSETYILPVKVSHFVEYLHDSKCLVLKQKLSRRDVRMIQESDEVHDQYLLDCLYRISDQCTRGFIREPHYVSITIKFENGKSLYEVDKIDGRQLKMVVLTKPERDGLVAITAMLVNTAVGSYDGTNSIFQPQIELKSDKNPGFKFYNYFGRNYSYRFDEEEESLDLLYRDKKVYATGHGVSVDWQIDKNGYGRLWTEFFPFNEVPQMDFTVKGLDEKALSMKYLSDLDSTPKDEKIAKMKGLIDTYSNWIREIAEKGSSLGLRFEKAVQRHVADCKQSAGRMYYGLELLLEDDIIYTAFQLTNRAMFMQRIHSELQRTDRYPGDKACQQMLANLNYYRVEENKYKWRPFQLAFILMNLRSITDENCDERDLVDLIWFPTGGGKTEAYLGLTAFTIFYRRLRFPTTSKGTTVIMRYTLRLLAAQQFIRASTLICACESIRKQYYTFRGKSKYPVYDLGRDKITIGLWIGSSHTPNRNDEAKTFLKKLLEATVSDLKETKERNHKFQVLKCPWCGTKLVKDWSEGGMVGSWGYFMKDQKHFRIKCTQEGCEFESELPIQVVDEELYISPPTLLFGTVDKFAMLPWKGQAGNFFAVSKKHRSPELIIQDELHLISGPLGSMVGLYETAVDALCSAKGIKPKIIASTATIRRAKDQCSNLFNREVKQFPAPGIDAGDSFFAREADLNEVPGRLYVGMMPAGKTKAMMEIRTIAAILQRVHMMDIPDEVKDKFWTLTVYFNSLRDLSKCMTLIDDDVKDFIQRMAVRFGEKKNKRIIGQAHELTSRVTTTVLNETLQKLSDLTYSKENLDQKKYPVNVLLATNMISVGVDVDRLNVMLLVGQPKLTSEYIQASSRVGRTYPGIVFVLYDGSKSRDRSFYEQFKGYHQSFYRFVEPTSVTPFSKPARDRALHALAVSLMRHLYGLTDDGDAGSFRKDMEETRKIESYIKERVSQIRSRNADWLKDETSDILSELQEFWREWDEKANRAEQNELYYGERYIVTVPPAEKRRLMKSYGGKGTDIARETPTSMRNVDQSITAGLLIWE